MNRANYLTFSSLQPINNCTSKTKSLIWGRNYQKELLLKKETLFNPILLQKEVFMHRWAEHSSWLMWSCLPSLWTDMNDVTAPMCASQFAWQWMARYGVNNFLARVDPQLQRVPMPQSLVLQAQHGLFSGELGMDALHQNCAAAASPADAFALQHTVAQSIPEKRHKLPCK